MDFWALRDVVDSIAAGILVENHQPLFIMLVYDKTASPPC
jgi:hypothetical protein